MSKIRFFIWIVFFISLSCYATPIEQLYFLNSDVISAHIYYRFPNEQGGHLLVGCFNRADGVSGFFITNLIPSESNSDSLVRDYYTEFLPPENNHIFVMNHCYQKENGNIVIIAPYAALQLQFDDMLECPYVIEFDNKGNLVYSYVDEGWDLTKGGTGSDDYGMVLYYGPYKSLLLHNNNFAVFHEVSISAGHPKDTLNKYRVIARLFDSVGNFIEVLPIKGVDVSKIDGAQYVNFSFFDVGYNSNNIIEIGLMKTHTFPMVQGQKTKKITQSYRLLLDTNFVVTKTTPMDEIIPQYKTFNSTEGYTDIKVRNEFVDKNGDIIIIQSLTNLLPDEQKDTSIINNYISVCNSSDYSLKRTYAFHESHYDKYTDHILTGQGEHLFAGFKRILWEEPNFTANRQSYAAAYIFSSDFQTFRTYTSPREITFSEWLNIGIERADGRFEFWGSSEDGSLLRVILDYNDFTNADLKVGINEIFLRTDFNSKLYPNPATDHTTITLELQQASQVHITLNDMLGREIKQIYNAFTDAGIFTYSFATQDLPKGIYYLKIFIGGEVKVEKVVVN